MSQNEVYKFNEQIKKELDDLFKSRADSLIKNILNICSDNNIVEQSQIKQEIIFEFIWLKNMVKYITTGKEG